VTAAEAIARLEECRAEAQSFLHLAHEMRAENAAQFGPEAARAALQSWTSLIAACDRAIDALKRDERAGRV
jgi:hypothetical protein